ncbi:ADP-ribosylation factor 4 [Seiridium cupressi]
MLSILRKARLKDKEMRILMLGLDNAGKTTIVKKIMNEDVNTVSPTLGFIIKTIDYEGYKLNISPEYEDRAMLTSSQRLSGASLLVFANKTDVQGCMDEEEILHGLQLKSIRTHRWQILQCSAMTGNNLKEGLAWIVADAISRLFLY